MSLAEFVPPQAPEAEMAVIGSMLIEKEAVERALDCVEEQHFYLERHKKIFHAIVQMYTRGDAVDLTTVSEELRRGKLLGEVGGNTYLAEMTGKVPTSAHVEHYAKIVKTKAILRELIRVSTEIVTKCHAESDQADILLDDAQSTILKIAEKQKSSSFKYPAPLAQETMERLDNLHKRKDAVTGVSTGFPDLDARTGGFQNSDLIILASRPSQGKTALALNIAAHVALDKNLPVALFSLEMNANAIFERLLCSQARMDLHQTRRGFFSTKHWPVITSILDSLSRAPIYIDDSSVLSVLELRTRARRLANECKTRGQKLALIIVDYLQLMRGFSARSESRQVEVSEISRGLKALARDLDVPVLALSQLSRRVEEKTREGNRPQLSDLRESGALEQDADVVAFIYREGYYKPNDPTLDRKAELIIAKQRNGPVGSVELQFTRECTKFDSVTYGVESPPAESHPAAV